MRNLCFMKDSPSEIDATKLKLPTPMLYHPLLAVGLFHTTSAVFACASSALLKVSLPLSGCCHTAIMLSHSRCLTRNFSRSLSALRQVGNKQIKLFMLSLVKYPSLSLPDGESTVNDLKELALALACLLSQATVRP